MTAMIRTAAPGDLDRIASTETGHDPLHETWTWIDAANERRANEMQLGVPREYPTPGRDCPACPAGRDEHDGWGAQSTGCRVPHWRLVKGTGVAR